MSNDDAEVGVETLMHVADRCDPRYGDFVPYLRSCLFGKMRENARRSRLAGTPSRWDGLEDRVCSRQGMADPGLGPDPGLGNSEVRGRICELLSTLEPRDREMVTLHYLDGVSFGEIAVKFGVDGDGVRELVACAVRRLRAAHHGSR